MNLQEYKKIKSKAYKEYKKIKKINCPYFKEYIYFTGRGFWHLVYEARNSKRENKIQILRFKLLIKAAKLLKITTTLQEYEVRLINRKKEYYYGFIAILKKDKIKVIIKKIGNGKYIFWSVIPN